MAWERLAVGVVLGDYLEFGFHAELDGVHARVPKYKSRNVRMFGFDSFQECPKCGSEDGGDGNGAIASTMMNSHIPE